MQGATRLIALACAATLSIAAGAGAQAPVGTCRPPDEMTTRLVEFFQRIVTPRTPSETGLRASLGLAGVSVSEVTPVADAELCARAGLAMQRLDQEPKARYALYVVHVGKSFGVMEPGWKAGEWIPTLVFDADWTLRRVVLAF